MEQSRQILAGVHHIIFRDALLRGIFAARVSYGYSPTTKIVLEH